MSGTDVVHGTVHEHVRGPDPGQCLLHVLPLHVRLCPSPGLLFYTLDPSVLDTDTDTETGRACLVIAVLMEQLEQTSRCPHTPFS
eukprot:866999-Rhodomonas_salina.1